MDRVQATRYTSESADRCAQRAVATGARHAFRILETELYKTDSPLFKSLTIQFGFFAATNKVAEHLLHIDPMIWPCLVTFRDIYFRRILHA